MRADTPRTDAAAFDITWRNGAYRVSIPNINHETVVSASFASLLETELTASAATIARLTAERDAAREDLRWSYDRLDHLMTIYSEGRMAEPGMPGPDDTMEWVNERLPMLRSRYGFEKAWPNGRFPAIAALRAAVPAKL